MKINDEMIKDLRISLALGGCEVSIPRMDKTEEAARRCFCHKMVHELIDFI
jgi:hypothetical protein